MTIRDIISHKTPANLFYQRLRPTTIAKAWEEPLRLSDLQKRGQDFAPSQVLPTGVEVSYGGALCYYCLQALVGKYTRSRKPDKYDLEYMAQEMMLKYKHWTVADLPTFVSMCIGARLPSMNFGELEYEIQVLDIPSIMGKLESYNKMRPNPEALQGSNPNKSVIKELSDWQKTHLIVGTPYDWTDMRSCEAYWRSDIDKLDKRDMDV